MAWLREAKPRAPTQAPATAHTPAPSAPTAQPAQSNGSLAEKFRQLEAKLNQRFVGREREIHAAVLALASGEPMYWEAPPGTAKTTIIETLASLIDARYFYYAMHEYVEPDEVLGPVDIVALRERGEFKRVTTGYLPEAEIVFIDEVYRASGAMLNLLIDVILNKRVKIGARTLKLPTVAMYFAANFRRAEEEFAAFHDRLTIRVFSGYLNDRQQLKELIQRGLELLRAKVLPNSSDVVMTVDEVRKFQQVAAVKAANIVANVIDKIAELVQHARSANIPVSDRRAVKLAYVAAVIALLDGRNSADGDDVAEAARLVLPLEPADLDRVEQIVTAMGLDTLRELRQKLSQLIDESKRLASMILEAYAKQLRGEEIPEEISDVIEAFRRTTSELERTLAKAKASAKTAKLVQQYLPRLREAIELMRKAEPIARELASRM